MEIGCFLCFTVTTQNLYLGSFGECNDAAWGGDPGVFYVEGGAESQMKKIKSESNKKI